MMKALLTAVAVLVAALSVLGSAAPPGPFEGAAPTPDTPIDKLVFAKLAKLGIQPANVCSDAVFVRRVYLDVIGTLPTAQEAKDFLQDTSPTKRHDLVDRLLARDEFADYWAMKWSDILRVKAEFPINLWPNAAQTYHRWIRTSLKENKPYDQFVREMLLANGSCFREPAVNFYRAMQNREPQGIAQTVALTFMGTRTEKWPKERLAGMAAFFSQIGFKSTGEWKEEIVSFGLVKEPPAIPTTMLTPAAAPPPAAAKAPAPAPAIAPQPAVFPDGTPGGLIPGKDPREAFANWLISPKNPWFAKNISNRAWSWLMGRGIIHEPDDIRPDNPPVNPELLAYLEKELVGARYDLKHLFRLILNSKTYQLSSIPQSKNPEGAANFAQYPLRRLEAEVMIDALDQITGTTEKYSSAIPEPFTFIPDNMRSIALPDGSISSSFLEMFGRPSRDTGLESERNNRPTADQRLHLLNSSHIQRKLEQSPKLRTLMQSKGNPREVVSNLYLTILSRFPTDDELKAVGAYSQAGGMGGTTAPTYSKGGGTGKGGGAPRTYSQGSSSKSATAAIDVAWALVNSAEFLYRH
jgi:hypothetical protein